ncbi:MAG: YceH family protein [Blastocatellia bacterium]
MDLKLTAEEARVLGALIEKQVTTPEYYPLSLNALTNACNQKSNREPVVSYDEKTVLNAMDGLRAKTLGWVIKRSDSRVWKYGQNTAEVFHLERSEVAALCALMLRGPLTVGEIRACAGRMYNFESLGEVEDALQRLADNDQGPMVVKLPRQSGRKEHRYAHLMCGEVAFEETAYSEPAPAAQDELREEVENLKRELQQLKEEFYSFRKQFE